MSFRNFPEQEQVVTILQRSLERKRLAHGYLFTGYNISELEAVARTLAKTLNCESPRRDSGVATDCCDTCASCLRIDGDNHPDVFWIRPESKSRVITIDEIRDLMQTINLKPTVAEFKVGVIVSADRLNHLAMNAFLKTLEEPPAKSILILLTTEPQRILDTILSRCLRLNFAGERKLCDSEVAWLSNFAEIAVGAKGGLLGRYRLVGILMKRLAELKVEIEENLTARSPLQRFDELDPRLREKMEEELSAAIEAEYRRQRTDLLLALQVWLRDVWLKTISSQEDLLALRQLSEMTKTIAQRVTAAEAIDNLQIIEQTQRLLGTNIQEALTLEVGFLKLKL